MKAWFLRGFWVGARGSTAKCFPPQDFSRGELVCWFPRLRSGLAFPKRGESVSVCEHLPSA